MLILEAPGRTLMQRQQALQRANEIRTWRAQLKRDVHDLHVLVHDVIADPEERLLSMQLRYLLKAVPHFGEARIMRVYKRVGISSTKTVGGLTDRQRTCLLAALRDEPVYARLMMAVA